MKLFVWKIELLYLNEASLFIRSYSEWFSPGLFVPLWLQPADLPIIRTANSTVPEQMQEYLCWLRLSGSDFHIQVEKF